MAIGTGWLGYTEQETLNTSIPALLAAHDAKIEMLKACYGTSETPDETPMAAQDVMSAFRAVASNDTKADPRRRKRD